jgi:hypothetical protein
MKIKEGVKLNGLNPIMTLALLVVKDVYDKYAGVELVITSATDGKHSNASFHYIGNALDIRTRGFKAQEHKKEAADKIRENLGQEFDVVLEKTHIHIEFQPKYKY